jgi:hypothetical protein
MPRFTEVFGTNISLVAVISGSGFVVTTGVSLATPFCGFATTAAADAVDVCDETLPEY